MNIKAISQAITPKYAFIPRLSHVPGSQADTNVASKGSAVRYPAMVQSSFNPWSTTCSHSPAVQPAACSQL